MGLQAESQSRLQTLAHALLEPEGEALITRPLCE